MIAGSLQVKNGYYYMVLLCPSKDGGKKSTKWISTGLKIKGNKKRAEEMLVKARQEYDPEETRKNEPSPLFADYMLNWLEMMRPNLEMSTFASYQINIERRIAPYFRETGIILAELKAADIQQYYQFLMFEKGISANTVIHYHANIRKALQHAMKTDLIPINPADKVQRPTKQKFMASFLDSEELNKLFYGVRGHRLELAVILGAFYGLRREEVVGLKWSAIDFQHKRITINHTVTQANVDGKRQIIEKDRAKNESSRRTLPLVPQFESLLVELRKRQESYRQVCGRCYNMEFIDYIYVDELGNRIKPDAISAGFPKLLAQIGIRRVRFHDLRHPYVKPTT